MKNFALFALVATSLSACNGGGSQSVGGSRAQIRVVGSSTLYPFATAVAEQFVKSNPGMKSPIIESTGTGAGMKLFCAGVGVKFPDVENASRRIKKKEFDLCAANGVKEIVEIQVGVDGLAFAGSKKGPGYKLTPTQIYKALAANPFGKGPNTATTWADVDPSLPKIAISVYGPPTTSGTRDSLAELILEKGCKSDPAMEALKEKNEDQYKATCTKIREDGKYVDSGENDNLIVQKLGANPNAVGIFGFSFLEENRDTLNDIPLNGIEATYDNVASGTYPGARPLYIYIKKAHIAAIPGLAAYAQEFANAGAPGGYLAKRGMVASSADLRKASIEAAKAMPVVDGSTLK